MTEVSDRNTLEGESGVTTTGSPATALDDMPPPANPAATTDAPMQSRGKTLIAIALVVLLGLGSVLGVIIAQAAQSPDATSAAPVATGTPEQQFSQEALLVQKQQGTLQTAIAAEDRAGVIAAGNDMVATTDRMQSLVDQLPAAAQPVAHEIVDAFSAYSKASVELGEAVGTPQQDEALKQYLAAAKALADKSSAALEQAGIN